MRGVWGQNAVGWVVAASMLPVIAALIFDQGQVAILRLIVCGGTVAIWQSVFRHSIGVPFTAAGAVTVVTLAMLAPAQAPLWQVALAVSFGAVVGELIFGGWGRNFLSGGTLGMAFLSLSLPAATYDPVGPMLALSVLPAALVLLATGILAFPVLVATFVGFLAAFLVFGADVGIVAVSGGLAFSAVYLIGDPVASAATSLGRWIYGLLAGALTGVLMASDVSATQSVIFAALLASIFAPLIDQGVIAAQLRLRKAHHG